jgi:phenylacetate-CoA ligase
VSASPSLAEIKSGTPGIEWPPIATGPAAVLLAYVHQCEDSQWFSPADIARNQHAQLGLLAEHAARHSPAFRKRLADAGLKPADLGTPSGLARLPPIVRRDMQNAPDGLFCDAVPQEHGHVSENRSTGSTGEPVMVKRTMIGQLDWLAMTMRDHFWWRRDFSWREAAVRAHIPAYAERESWGPPASLLFKTGPAARIPIETDIAEQVRLLRAFRPDTLIVHPSNALALADHCREHDLGLDSLKQVRMFGETLWPHVSEQVGAFFGAAVTDCYSSQEVGYIALQCPESLQYHVCAESVLVEILDEVGNPCREGEQGRVTLTDLHNFATPIVRYDIGDYAEQGGRCTCGRGLPTIARVIGKERNLILMPDGRRFWPLVGIYRVREVAPVRRYQFIQHDRERIEVRLVVDDGFVPAHEDNLREMIHRILRHPFALEFTYLPGPMPTGPGGKFEQFICKAS